MVLESFFSPFGQFQFFSQTDYFAWWPFLAIFRIVPFFEYKLFFLTVSYIEQLLCASRTSFLIFFLFLIFAPIANAAIADRSNNKCYSF